MAETQDTTVLVAEALGRGKKNLIIENYAEAAEEFSSVCEMLTELHGATGDQLAEAYFLYGRALLGCAREEAKLLDITETAPTEDSESEVESKEKKGDDEAAVSSSSDVKASATSSGDQAEMETIVETDESTEKEKAKENGSGDHQDEDENVEENTATAGDEDDESDGDVGSLQLAWEVLELSSQILSKKDDDESKRLLAEVFSELGEVSLESSNFETASKDFVRSLEIYEKFEKPMPREIAEAHFKIGLSHAMMNLFEEAVKDFTLAVEILDGVIKETPSEEKTLLEELNQTREEILLKITDVKESKEQSIEAIREQLNKVWPKTSSLGSSNNGAGPSSSTNGDSSELSAQSDKPAVDISHLVKRKRKTDEPTEEAVCAKKATP